MSGQPPAQQGLRATSAHHARPLTPRPPMRPTPPSPAGPAPRHLSTPRRARASPTTTGRAPAPTRSIWLRVERYRGGCGYRPQRTCA
eukprot:364326-Chlamydomonas_euryale.AAC.6